MLSLFKSHILYFFSAYIRVSVCASNNSFPNVRQMTGVSVADVCAALDLFSSSLPLTAGFVPLPPQRLRDNTIFSTVLAGGLLRIIGGCCDILPGVPEPSISTDGSVLAVGATKGPKAKRVGPKARVG